MCESRRVSNPPTTATIPLTHIQTSPINSVPCMLCCPGYDPERRIVVDSGMVIKEEGADPSHHGRGGAGSQGPGLSSQHLLSTSTTSGSLPPPPVPSPAPSSSMGQVQVRAAGCALQAGPPLHAAPRAAGPAIPGVISPPKGRSFEGRGAVAVKKGTDAGISSESPTVADNRIVYFKNHKDNSNMTCFSGI